MGAAVVSLCGKSDFFQKLLEQYGDDFVKLILSQKAKQALQQKFKQIINKIKSYVTIFEIKVNGIVDQKIKQLNVKFQQIKNKISSVIPGGIPYLQRQKGQSINQFSGFNSILNQIDSIRDRTLKQVNQQKGQIQNQLLQKKNIIYNQIQEQRPKVPLYQQLPDNIRYRILVKGEKQFKQQIQKNQEKVNNDCDKRFNEDFSQMDEYFNQINPQSILDDLLQKSIKDMVNKVAGNGVGGKINRFIDKVF